MVPADTERVTCSVCGTVLATMLPGPVLVGPGGKCPGAGPVHCWGNTRCCRDVINDVINYGLLEQMVIGDAK